MDSFVDHIVGSFVGPIVDCIVNFGGAFYDWISGRLVIGLGEE